MKRILITLLASTAIVVLAILFGSVNISLHEIVSIIAYRVFGRALPEDITAPTVAILWNLRLPRVLLAFLAGAALSVSGAIMQSILRNPLASSYTLGVSSGASLGAVLTIVYGISFPLFQSLTLPLFGFVFGMGTILFVYTLARVLDERVQNHTIILVGVVLSLFVGSIVTLLATVEETSLQRLIFWQLGSFSMRGWDAIYILTPILFLATFFVCLKHRELDLMTFGEESAAMAGVNVRQIKWLLLIVSSALTGATIAFVGVIGFVDLIVPHVVRRLFGARHRLVLPMCILFGGAFMVLADFCARMFIARSELPVGVVTALVGAPFFLYIFWSSRRRPC